MGPIFCAPLETGSTIATKSKATWSGWRGGILITEYSVELCEISKRGLLDDLETSKGSSFRIVSLVITEMDYC